MSDKSGFAIILHIIQTYLLKKAQSNRKHEPQRGCVLI